MWYPMKTHQYFGSLDRYVELIDKHARNRALRSGKLLHSHLIVNGFSRSTNVATKLIAFYTACRQLGDARRVFDQIPQTNVGRWVVLIGACARQGFHQETMDVFCDMRRAGLRLDRFVVPSVLKSCGHLFDRSTGEKVHAVVLKYEYERDVFVGSALIDMYSKCRQIEKARRVFDGMGEIDLVAINTMVAGYVQVGLVRRALGLVEEMRSMGVEPNVETWNALIAGFSQTNDEVMVADIFRLMQDSGVDPDVVSWTSVISGFVQNFRNGNAFDSFKRMLDRGVRPNSATISGLLPACATVADLRHGKEIHGYSVVIGVEDDLFVCSALIDMYAKCGFIYEARRMFDKMSERNTVTWNSMIFGYANHGYCSEAITLFDQMVDEEKKPDHLTFTAVLTACCHSGVLELGEKLFLSMQEKYGIEPRAEHYACLVNLLGREGKVAEAYDLIQKMPIKPDLFVWGALLGACRHHGNVGLAEIAAAHLAELEPDSSASSLLLSNLYADVGSWAYATRVKRKMKKKKAVEFPSRSWIDMDHINN